MQLSIIRLLLADSGPDGLFSYVLTNDTPALCGLNALKKDSGY
jgi:hypothetical protein